MTTLRRLEGLRREPPKLLAHLASVAREHGINAAVSDAKASGVLVDTVGDGKRLQTAASVIKLLDDIAGPDASALTLLKSDAALFNAVFGAFFRFRASSAASRISPTDRVAAFLLATEMWIGAAQSSIPGHQVPLSVYPFRALPELTSEPLARDNLPRLMGIVESLSEYASSAYKYLMYASPPPTLQQRIDLDDIVHSVDHLSLVDKWQYYCWLFDFWRFFEARLEVYGSTIRYIVKDMASFHESIISPERFNSYQTVIGYQVGQQLSRVINEHTVRLPPKGLQSFGELIATDLWLELMGDDSLQRTCAGAGVSSWIRAYGVVAERCLNKLAERSADLPFDIAHWFVCMKPSEWDDAFLRAGVPMAELSSVRTGMTFSRQSIDFYDCPLVPINGLLCALPSVTWSTQSSRAMLSNFGRLDVGLNFKGPGLERRIRASIEALGIACKSIDVAVKGRSYQCDCVFVLDDDLYMAEIKSTQQPFDVRGLHLLNEDLTKFAQQHNRICDFFEANLHYVGDRLGLAKGWTPKRIIRLIICSAMLGAPKMVDGCRVVDLSAFE